MRGIVIQIHLAKQVGKAEHAIHRRANFVAHIGEELRLCPRRVFGMPRGALELAFQQHPVGHVAGRNDDAVPLTCRAIIGDGAIRFDIDGLAFCIVEHAPVGQPFHFAITAQ